MQFNIITIFPKIFDSYLNESIIKRALNKKNISINPVNLRDFTTDKHKTVDDTPYGGGAGMLMMIKPLYKALKSLKKQGNKETRMQTNFKSQISSHKTILLSAKGKRWNQKMAQEYSRLNSITMICGRYEGVDDRIIEFIDEEISIGDFVLTGGELGAMVILDSVTRLLPGVLGNDESAILESHTITGELEYPQYTRPEIFKTKDGKEYKVPEVLLSGHHKKILEWRERNKKKK